MKTTSVYILGQQGAGKTTILNQLHTYSRSKFPDATKLTSNRLEITINEARFVISEANLPRTLWSIYLHMVSMGDKFILVYAVDDNDSFEYIESIKDFLKSRKGEGVPIIVLGNKNDISERALRYELVDCLVSIDWGMKYIEMSALTGDCVPTILTSLFPEKEHVLLPPTKDDNDPLECPPRAFRQRSNTDSDVTGMKQTRTQRRRSTIDNQGLLPRKDGKNERNPFRRFSLPNFSIAVRLSNYRLLGDTECDTTLVDGNIGPDSTLYENKEEIETVWRKEQSGTHVSLPVDLSASPLQESCEKERISGIVSQKRRRSSLISKLMCLFAKKES